MQTDSAPDLSTPRAASEGATVRTLGRTDYEATWRAMQAFTDARSATTADEIWLTEHEPVYTLGLAGRRSTLVRTIIDVAPCTRVMVLAAQLDADEILDALAAGASGYVAADEMRTVRLRRSQCASR